MTDKYIDLDETQIYGRHASNMILAQIVGMESEFDAGLKKVAAELDDCTAEVHQAIESSRDASATVRTVSAEKGPALKRAINLLGRFSTHLDTHEKGTVDRLRFFPEKGTARGVGHSAPRAAIALGRIMTLLEKPDCRVSSREEWLKEFRTVSAMLTPHIEHSNNAKTDRVAATPELDAARQAWLQVYAAAKCCVECVLRLNGNMHLMPVVFYDLAVPGTSKVTEIPEPPVPNQPHNP